MTIREYRYRPSGVPVLREPRSPDANRRRYGALAHRLDAALEKGGDFTQIAADLNLTRRSRVGDPITAAAVRAHVKDRVDSGKWRFVASAGRLIRIKEEK